MDLRPLKLLSGLYKYRPRKAEGQSGNKKTGWAVLAAAAGIVSAGIFLGARSAKKRGKKKKELPEPAVPAFIEVPRGTAASGSPPLRKRRLGKPLRVCLALLCICCLVYAGVTLVRYFGDSISTESGIEELRSGILETAAVTQALSSESAVSPQPPQEERNYEVFGWFSELYGRNNDMVGWLTIGGTNIDYPVMQSDEDEQFYIEHNFDREFDENGLPFLDARCGIAPKSQIQLVYGHNIKSGIMFHDLMRYESGEFWKEHQFINYSTLYDEATYQVVAAFVFDVAGSEAGGFQFHRFTEFPSESVFEAYKEKIRELALYDTETEYTFRDHYLILATCEYSGGDGRFVVIAKLIDPP